MSSTLNIKVDVTAKANLGEPAHVAVTIHLPDPETLPARPVICFAKPGGGYSKGYYTVDLPGPASGAQADWHVQRGWIFVSVDHLGVGDSSLHAPEKLDYTTVAAGSQAAEQDILQRLAQGTLQVGFPKVETPLKIGIGQSMGGCMTIIQQGRYHCYDGIGVLGYSAVHTNPLHKPGTPPIVAPWLPRDTLLTQPLVIVNRGAVAKAQPDPDAPVSSSAMGWGFHYDDVDPAIVESDLAHFARGIHDPELHKGYTPNPWNSFTTPGAVAQSTLTPGTVAPEAAAVTCPVLVAMGERDVCVDPRGELRAYKSSLSVDYFECPRMGHMHNFAGTRELFWQRIDHWVNWVKTYQNSAIF